MRHLFILIVSAISLSVAAQTRYTTTSQGANTGYGGAYVAPIVTKTYTFPASGSKASYQQSSTGSTISAGSSGYTGGSGVLYRRNFREERYERRQAKERVKQAIAARDAAGWKSVADQVIDAYNEGDLEKANTLRKTIDIFNPCCSDAPWDDGLHLPGTVRFEYVLRYQHVYIILAAWAGDYKDARSWYEALFTQYEMKAGQPDNPDKPRTYYCMEQTAYLEMRFGLFTYAEQLLKEAAYIEALHHMAGATKARTYLDAVSNFYYPYIKGKITDPVAQSHCYNTLAILHLDLGKPAEAVKFLEKQILLHPGDASLRMTIVWNLMEYNVTRPLDPVAANFCLRELNKLRAAGVQMSDTGAAYNMSIQEALLYFSARNYEAARSLLRSLTVVPKESKMAYNAFLVRVLSETDSVASAEQVFKEVLAPDPSRTMSDLILGYTLDAEYNMRFKKDYAHAEKLYSLMSESNPDDWSLSLRLAEIYGFSQKNKEATMLFKKLIKQNPEEYLPHLRFADFLKATGETRDAKEHYRDALALGALLPDDITQFIKTK